MRLYPLGLVAMAASLMPLGQAAAQAPSDRSEVLATVQALFDGMRQRDTAKIRATFAPGAKLMSAGRAQDGSPQVEETSVDDFIGSIGRVAPGQLLDERISDTEVDIDGNLASVWTYYEFWLGDRFSHCGVDAFHMARTAAGWQILHLVDTRRRQGCKTQPAG